MAPQETLLVCIGSRIFLRKTRRKILCSAGDIARLHRQSHFPSENKEENPLLLHRQSHFPSENKEDLNMCFTFNSCSELFNVICKYFNFGC